MKILCLIMIVGFGTAPALTWGESAEQQKSTAGVTALAGITEIYKSLAESILSNKQSEKGVVLAILEVERDLILAALDRAREHAPSGAASDLEVAARHLGNFATEGGAAVEPIRNRLLKGGHHHHAQDTGPEAVYDKGYVVLNKKSKREALAIAKRCAVMASGSEAQQGDIDAIRAAFSSLAGNCLKRK